MRKYPYNSQATGKFKGRKKNVYLGREKRYLLPGRCMDIVCLHGVEA